MQRSTINPAPLREEWTKYFVNGIECEKEAIYQTILDRQFYNGKVNLDKKYHFKIREEKAEHSMFAGFMFPLSQSTRDESKNQSANFNLDTKKFAEKFRPEGAEFKLLIDKMIHTLDMFYAAQNDYSGNSQNFRNATRDCMTYYLENTTDCRAPYNDIMHAFSLDYFEFLSDMFAYAYSKIDFDKEGPSNKVTLPNLNFDTSSIKATWDEKWDNDKKAQYIKKYFTVMLNQANKICKDWMKNDLFTDQLSHRELQGRFDDFKKSIKSMQAKLGDLNADHKQSIVSKISFLFHHRRQRTNESPLSDSTQVVRPDNQPRDIKPN